MNESLTHILSGNIPCQQDKSHRIIPFFLPFLGCPSRCIFCGQDRQTGITANLTKEYIFSKLKQLQASLEKDKIQNKEKPELAFYGGTFVSLPPPLWQICIDAADFMHSNKLISSFRCSTRPDSLNEKRLVELHNAGCQVIELGIQSFCDTALKAAKRHYHTEDCLSACRKVKEYDFKLGVQLMPGMPAVTENVFLDDVATAIANKADFLRFYPCLVIDGTLLATMWHEGKYKPWTLDLTINTLAHALNMAEKENVKVIRMGLAPQTTLQSAILAGPAHPSLGSRVMGRALFIKIADLYAELKTKDQTLKEIRMFTPLHTKGYLWGWKNELQSDWHKIGISKNNLTYWNKNISRIELF